MEGSRKGGGASSKGGGIRSLWDGIWEDMWDEGIAKGMGGELESRCMSATLACYDTRVEKALASSSLIYVIIISLLKVVKEIDRYAKRSCPNL